jgi:hypothetical protein
MKKELKDLKETYRPYWEEMKAEVKGFGYWISDTKYAELHSILNRAYMQALEIGFNEGMGFQINKTTKK